MSWEGYWFPHLVDWIVGGTVLTVVGGVVGLVLRRLLREIRAAQQATAISARIGAQSAHHAARRADATHDATSSVLERLTALEGSSDGLRDAVSASLARRALDDLRFREIEAQLAPRMGGRHAGGDGTEVD